MAWPATWTDVNADFVIVHVVKLTGTVVEDVRATIQPDPVAFERFDQQVRQTSEVPIKADGRPRVPASNELTLRNIAELKLGQVDVIVGD
jgi:hypothetical protein